MSLSEHFYRYYSVLQWDVRISASGYVNFEKKDCEKTVFDVAFCAKVCQLAINDVCQPVQGPGIDVCQPGIYSYNTAVATVGVGIRIEIQVHYASQAFMENISARKSITLCQPRVRHMIICSNFSTTIFIEKCRNKKTV